MTVDVLKQDNEKLIKMCLNSGWKKAELMKELDKNSNYFAQKVVRVAEIPQKTKVKRGKYATKMPYYNINEKLKRFNKKGINLFGTKYSLQDFFNYFQNQQFCYLTGVPVDIYNSSTYSLDHYIPSSRGGPNSLENMRICLTPVNIMKWIMSVDELLFYCRQIVKHHDYPVKNELNYDI